MECAKDKFEDTKQIKFDCLILFVMQIWKCKILKISSLTAVVEADTN